MVKTIEATEVVEQRAAGPSELIFIEAHRQLGGYTQSVMAAEFVDPFPFEAIMAGLEQLHRRHPMLRARLGGEGPNWTFVVNVPFGSVSIRSVEESSGSLEDLYSAECDDPLDIVQGPLWRAVLIRKTADGAVTGVIVTFAHAILDGVSGVGFLHELVAEATGRSSTSAEPYALPVALDDLLDRCPDGEDEQPVPESAGTWAFGGRTQRRTSLVLEDLEGPTFAALRERCRAEGVGVEALLTSAMVEAFGKHVPEACALPIMLTADLRNRVTPPVPPGVMGGYAKELPLAGLAEEGDPPDLWARARRVDELRAEKSRDILRTTPMEPEAIAELMALANGDVMSAFLFGCSVSNLGSQESTDGQAVFRSLYLSSTDCLGVIGIQVIVVGLQDRLCVTFVHCDPLVSRATAELLMAHFLTTLRTAAIGTRSGERR